MFLHSLSSCNSEGLDALNSMSMLVVAHLDAEAGSHSAFLFWLGLVCSVRNSKMKLLSESIRKAIELEQGCTIVYIHHNPTDDYEYECSNVCE